MIELEICQPPKERGPYFQKEKPLAPIMKRIDNDLVSLAEKRAQGKLSSDLLKPYALDIYTWRDAVNELIKVLERR